LVGVNAGCDNKSCPYDQLSGITIEKSVLPTFVKASTLDIDNDMATTTASKDIDIRDKLIS